jgi:hypothetical protein
MADEGVCWLGVCVLNEICEMDNSRNAPSCSSPVNFASNELVVFYNTPTSISNLKSSEYFKLFPNPSNGLLHILTEPEKSFTVELISCEGKILKIVSSELDFWI